MWVPQEREEVDPGAAAGVGEGRAQAAQVAPQRREGRPAPPGGGQRGPREELAIC